MAFTASFQVIQTNDCSRFTVQDVSNYGGGEPKSAFSKRELFIHKADGSLIPFTNSPDFSFADYPLDLLNISGVQSDYSLRIRLVLTPLIVVPSSVYVYESVVTITCYTKKFLYGIIQDLTANPSIINQSKFRKNLFDAHCELSNAELATTFADQQSAQLSLNRAKYFIDNKNICF